MTKKHIIMLVVATSMYITAITGDIFAKIVEPEVQNLLSKHSVVCKYFHVLNSILLVLTVGRGSVRKIQTSEVQM